MVTMPAERIHYFDWLRAAAVLGVVLYHALLPFTGGWWINNAEQSELLDAVIFFFETFGLGLLFLLAGASVRFALRTRSMRAFLIERAARLLIPFVVGTLLLTPPIMYVAAVHDGSTSESFVAFLAGWPAGMIRWAVDIGFSPKLFEVGFHLWFLGWLFAVSVLGLPIFAFLSSGRGQALVAALARLARWPGATLLFALPITLPPFVLFAGSTEERDWWTFGWYGATFLVGYVLYADDRLVAAVRRDLRPALIIGTVTLIGMLAFDFEGWAEARDTVAFSYDATYLLMVSLYGMTGWAWTIVLLNLGIRARFMQRPLSRLANEAVLPIYVLHLPIVLAISFFVVQWPLGLATKALVNVGLGVGVTVLVATAALRLPFLRPLLGARQRPQGATAPALVAGPLRPDV